MVNQSVQSLLADYAQFDEVMGGAQPSRHFSPKREQPSRARYATEARYRRKRSPGAPAGPRRRLRKSS